MPELSVPELSDFERGLLLGILLARTVAGLLSSLGDWRLVYAIAAAALRELAEETGLMVGGPGHAAVNWPEYRQAGLVPDASALIYVFRAITPPGRPRRFDARFFMIDAEHLHGDRNDFSRASDELSHLHWVALGEARRLNLPFITEVVLAEVQALVAAAGDGPLRAPESVPFFDNEGPTPGFRRID